MDALDNAIRDNVDKLAKYSQYLKDLRVLIGEKQFNRFVRTRLQKGFDDSLITGSQTGELMFDPYKFEKKLGLNTEAGRELMKIFLKESKFT